MNTRIRYGLTALIAVLTLLFTAAALRAPAPKTGRLETAAAPAGEAGNTATGPAEQNAPAAQTPVPSAESALPEETTAALAAPAELPRLKAETATATATPDAAVPVTLPDGQDKTPKNAAAVTKTTRMVAGTDYTDQLTTGDDVHWYVFRVTERGMLKLRLRSMKEESLSSRVLTLYQVYRKNGTDGETGLRKLTTLHAFAADKASETPCIGVTPGEYRAAVTSGDVTALTPYALRLEFSARTDYEIECNDTITRYTELTSGVQTRGSASYSDDGPDRDWYLFRVYHGGTVEVKFRHAAQEQPTAAYKVTLYNEDMEVLYTGISALNQDTMKSGAVGAAPGIYYVLVESRVYYAGDYGLTLTAETDETFETEPNDAPETAAQLPAGGTARGALTPRGAEPDADWYACVLSAPGLVTVTLDAEADEEEDKGTGKDDAAKAIFRLTVLDAAGTPVYAAVSTNVAPGIRTPALGLPAGVFYIRIDNRGLYEDRRFYTLRCETAAAACETESNDAPTAADPLAMNAPLTGTVADGEAADTDCFTFTLKTAKTVSVTLTHASALAGNREIYELRLLDAAGNAAADTAGRTTRAVTAGEKSSRGSYALPAGTYTVVLTAGLFTDPGQYTLLLSE